MSRPTPCTTSRALLFLCPLLLVSANAPADDALAAGSDLAAAIELYEAGHYERAEEALLVLRKRDGDPDSSFYLGRVGEQRGDFESAAEYMEEASELVPENSVYRQKLGEYYGMLAGSASVFKAVGLAKKSRVAFEKAVELDGSNLDARSGLLSFYLQAPAMVGGSEEKALEQAEEIFRQDPVRGHLARAQIYQEQDDPDAAEREYRAAIETDPAPAGAWLALGIFLTAEERYDDALALYRERLTTVPDDMPIIYQLGKTVSISGQSLEEGRAALQRYLAEHQPAPGDPGHDWAHYRLGLIHQQMGDREAARREYEAALAVNTDHPEAGKALKKLR